MTATSRKEGYLDDIARWKGVLEDSRRRAEQKAWGMINWTAKRVVGEDMKTVCEGGKELCTEGHDIFDYYADMTEALYYIEVLEKFEELDDEEWTMKVEGRFEQFMDLLHSVTGV